MPRTAWLEIDLDALRSNLAAIRTLVGPAVLVEPVVKADAYGHGSTPVALALEEAGADGLSVATFDEALELREGGVALPILVVYPVPASVVAEAAAERISLSVGSGRALTETLDAARAVVRDGAPRVAVQLEVETGLGRGGALPGDVALALDSIAACPAVRLRGVWTHLAAPDDDARSRRQDEAFAAALPLVDALGWGVTGAGEPVRRHLAASGGLLGEVVARYDAVRAGLALYGLVPDEVTPAPGTLETAASLRPVMALVTRPVRVADLPAGHGVGYGPGFVTARPSRIATLPVGYADGWRRSFARADALVRGVRVPLVGSVAMDGVMADVSDVPGPPVTEDDELVLLGEQGDERIDAGELASVARTIRYDVVASMSRRMTRVYHAAGVPVGLRTLAGRRADWRGSSSGTATSAISRSTPS